MITLPWTSESAPHLVLEVNDRCNIACRGCYRTPRADGHKTAPQVLAELDGALRLRRVHTVSLAGGEPTLNPHLPDIVRGIHRRRFRTAVLTNGVDLPDSMLVSLKHAGLDLVQLHIDAGQSRPDLPGHPTVADIHGLRNRIGERVARAGMDAGLCATLFPNSVETPSALVDHVIRSPWIHFLFASHFFEPAGFARALAGRDSRWRPATSNTQVMAELAHTLGLEPFACLREPNGTKDTEAPGWITYLVPVARGRDGLRQLRLRSRPADMLPFYLARLLTGRYTFYFRPHRAAIVAQIILNGLWSGRMGAALAFLRGSSRRGAELGCKRIVFDNGPRVLPDGRTECADFCPNATWRDGRLVGICTADIVRA